MTKIDDGGPAFAAACANESTGWTQEGMSLRDHFAGQALAGDFAAQGKTTGDIPTDASAFWMQSRARVFYRMADAMIAVRKSEGQ